MIASESKVVSGKVMFVALRYLTLFIGILLVNASALTAEQLGAWKDPGEPGLDPSYSEPPYDYCHTGSPYIPVDSWVYPAMLRLYSLGFGQNVYLGMRPWTRASISHMLEAATSQLQDAETYGDPAAGEARDIYKAMTRELCFDSPYSRRAHESYSRVESLYSVARAVSGTSLRDSFHLGSSIINDYGRPYASGFNSYSGASGYVSLGRFAMYARGEFQRAPSATGYSSSMAQTLSTIDEIPYTDSSGVIINQATIPLGPIATAIDGRFVEVYASAQYFNHVLSLGKQDDWLGPGMGGAMAYSNNAENIYSLRINRIEPLDIPLLSKLTGPFRYEFLVGSLKGHTYPNDPWVHLEKVSFRPTENLELGFERTVIWGGKGHEPITLHTFLRSFFSLSAPNSTVKHSSQDPGARFGAFDFSYRLPFVRNWLTLYSDSEVHDDISPIDAPRRAAFRPGIYLSHMPGIPKLDLRAEAVSTDPPVSSSQGGTFMYFETVQRQGYTNKGVLLGDWIGREGKGGQGWITYHLSGNEWLLLGIRNQKVAKDFIPDGTTLNDINFQAVKRFGKDFELDGQFSYENWKAPIYLSGRQTVTNTTIQLYWFPKSKVCRKSHP